LPDASRQLPVVASASDAVSPFREVVADEPLEVIEPSVGHEDCRERSITLLPDVQQLDSRPLARQALEGEFDVREALELDPQSQLVQASSLLSISGGVSVRPQRFELALQCSGVAGAVALWYNSRTSELLW
jgi:hypothetical protein